MCASRNKLMAMAGLIGTISPMLSLLLMLPVIVVASDRGYSYGANPNEETTSLDPTGKQFIPEVFTVQGIVYCKSGHKLFPLKGGVIRISCLGIDEDGYETAPFSILSRPTDANGYFLAKLSAKLLENDGVRVSQCKAFLHGSAAKSCRAATDVNKGLSGAALSAYRLVGSGGMRLYSVGPFVYV